MAQDIRVGIVGKRGGSSLLGLRSVEGVKVTAACEIDPASLAAMQAELRLEQGFANFTEMLDHVDAVVIGTPMHLHAAQCGEALLAGKHVLSEVTAAVTIDECWDLLDAVQAGGKTYMLAENYCYSEENILVRELSRLGVFGEVYFAEGEYVHEVRFLHHNPDGSPTWRARWQVGVPGNTYITHEIGPPMQWIKAQNPLDRIESVTCLGCGIHTAPEHPHDDTTITLIKLASGKLIKVRLDMMSNTPGLVYYSLQGINGTYESGRGGGVDPRIWIGENKTLHWDDGHREWGTLDAYRHHIPAKWAQHLQAAKSGGHGGGDYHTGRLFAESIRDGSPPDIDIYDALEWTAAGLCSQVSIAQGGSPVTVPDFRRPRQGA